MSLYADIEKRLGDFHLKVRLEADEGVTALLGASGCGKSVTLKCIAGIMTPDRGRITLDGRVLFDSEARIDLPPQQRRVGYLFQNYALFPNMTVGKNLLCGIRAGTRAERAAVEDALRRFRLEGLERHYPAQLSGGQQQRAALARLLCAKPDVILLDEPFSALDSHLRFHLERELASLLRQYGKPAVLVSHDRDEAFRLADRIAVMDRGRVETAGTRQEVFQAPRTLAAARLTGCKNISRLRRETDGTVTALDWGVRLRLPETVGPGDYVGIRMHSLRPGQAGEENAVLCRVTEEVEGPFSYTVMLRPADAPEGPSFGWELEKDQWPPLRQTALWVRFPPEALLLLTERGEG